jgi:hypothetical protein
MTVFLDVFFNIFFISNLTGLNVNLFNLQVKNEKISSFSFPYF